MSTTLQKDLSKPIQYNPQAVRSIDTALQQIFKAQEHTKVQKARAIMGNLVEMLPDEELEIQIIEIQYLLEAWIDEFERLNFDGQTLKELLVE